MVSDNRSPKPSPHPRHDEEPIQIGVSSCLLGAEVRYDGGHKRDRYLTDVLGEWFHWLPVCPEVDRVLRRHRWRIQSRLGLDPQQSAELDTANRLLMEKLRVKRVKG